MNITRNLLHEWYHGGPEPRQTFRGWRRRTSA